MPNNNYLQQVQNSGGAVPNNQLVILPGGGSVFGSVNNGFGNATLLNNGTVSNGGSASGTSGTNTPTNTPGTVLNPTGNTTTGTTTTTTTPATTTTTPSTSTTTAPTGQEADAAPVSPAKVWYQDWKVWAAAAVVISAVYYMYLKAKK